MFSFQQNVIIKVKQKLSTYLNVRRLSSERWNVFWMRLVIDNTPSPKSRIVSSPVCVFVSFVNLNSISGLGLTRARINIKYKL